MINNINPSCNSFSQNVINDNIFGFNESNNKSGHDSSLAYLNSFGGNIPSWLKDLQAELNLAQPTLANDVNFGEFHPYELSKPKSKSSKSSKKGGAGSLGNITKSASSQSGGDFQKSKFLQVKKNYPVFTQSDFIPVNAKFNFATGNLNEKETRRSVRYKLLQVSQHILPNNHRVGTCLRYRISKDENVKIFQHQEHGCLHYGNLMRCGSVWLCPVCGAKISEVRRLELQQAKEEWLKQGGHVYMLTLTTPHYSFTDLRQLIDQQANALRYFWGGRGGEQLKDDLRYVGQIRAFEVTYGDENGFHPHYHVLLFTKVNLEDDRLYVSFAKRFAKRWEESCLKSGLGKPSEEHGCQLQDGSSAFEYINKYGNDDDFSLPEFDGFASASKSYNPSKIKVRVDESNRWNSSHELTKANSKTGKKGRLTPFDFLRKFNDDPQKYGELWTTYANGVHGKAQLFWSHGLKELLGIKQNNDQAIAENGAVSELVGDNNDLSIINATQKLSELVREIDNTTWGFIRNHRKQHHVLLLCKYDLLQGTNFLDEYLIELVAFEKSLLDIKLAESPPKPKPKLSVKELNRMKVEHEFDCKYGSLAKTNPYPSGSPSHETWEKKYGQGNI
jgi:hypothetical protein